MGFEFNQTHEAEANWPTANNFCYITRRRLSTHYQPWYVGNSDIHIKSVVAWQEDHSGVGSEIWLGLLCILRKCGTVNWIVRAEWAWSVSGLGRCDTVHILSRAAGEGTKLQCYHTNNEWCGPNHHHFFKETVGKAKLVFSTDYNHNHCIAHWFLAAGKV